MSKYKVIQTQYKDESCLVAALRELGYKPEVHQTPAHLVGYHGDIRQDTAHVIVRRKQFNSYSNDLGFLRQADGTYKVIISDYDSVDREADGYITGATITKKLIPLYAEQDLRRRAKAKGLTMVKKVSKNGKAVITFRGYR